MNMKPRTKRQIDRLIIDREKPLFISDADEVVLYFAKHFKSFLESRGWALNLSGYRLDKAITHKTDGYHPDKSVAQSLVEKFIRQETINQKLTKNSKETLERISKIASVVILTNVPEYAHESREKNFKKLGLNYPIISNSGPKGSAINYLTKNITKPCFFVDDSPFQIESASNENDKLISIHFSACEIVKKVLPPSSFASYTPERWSEIELIVKKEVHNATK